jgi:hypothetical protein
VRLARCVLAALALSCAGCTDYGVDIDPTFTEAERADIYAAIDAWEQSTPRWRAAVGPHVVHLRRVAVLPDNWWGATTRSTRTVRLLPSVVAGPLFRRLIVHELGHVAGLGHVPDDVTYATVMHHEMTLDVDGPTNRDVSALPL